MALRGERTERLLERIDSERQVFEVGRNDRLPASLPVGRVRGRILLLAVLIIAVVAILGYDIGSWKQTAGLLLTVAGLLGALAAYLAKYEPEALISLRKLFFFGLLNLVVLAIGKVITVAGAGTGIETGSGLEYLVPVGFPAMIGTLVFGARVAAMSTAVLSLLVGIEMGMELGDDMRMAIELGGNMKVTISLLVGSLAALMIVDRAEQRPSITWAGAMAGLVFFAAIVSLELLAGRDDFKGLVTRGGWGLLNGVGSGVFVLGTLRFWEQLFGVTTTIRLLELSDQNHRALRDLERRAPGTYLHSLNVGTLCEAACEAIGANALLARVASYYHDIGKIAKPEYFVENAAPGKSRHDGLSPHMSSMIIISHVKDGIELAGDYKLPPVIIDFIAQHHGTTIVEFFHRKAVEQAEPNGQPVPDDSLFRYPGPKPQTREAAVMLLADTVEAASRTLEDPSPARLRAFVEELSQHKQEDGQFNECPLTLTELKRVEEAIIGQLVSMFHQRVRYPDPAPEVVR